MGINPRQLRDLSDEVDQLHHESMRTVREAYGEIHLGGLAREHGPARRRFLQQVAAGGAMLTVGSQLLPLGRMLPAAWAQADDEGPDDIAIAAFAASVELAAAAGYRAAIETGMLSELVAPVARTFGSHHGEHAGALNEFLAQPIEDPNAGLVDMLTPRFERANSQTALLEILLEVEEAAAATYYVALGTLDQVPAAAIATILPVESQHAVVWATVTGQPVEDYIPELQGDDGAVSPEEFPLPSEEGEDPEPSPSTTQPSGGGGGGEEGEGEGEGGTGDSGSGDAGGSGSGSGS